VGDGSYRLGAGDCSLCHGSARREKRELFSFKESELQPASDVVHDEHGSPSGSHVCTVCYRFETLYLGSSRLLTLIEFRYNRYS
jgi:hypothetical protein